jgi:hypothetical protein
MILPNTIHENMIKDDAWVWILAEKLTDDETEARGHWIMTLPSYFNAEILATLSISSIYSYNILSQVNIYSIVILNAGKTKCNHLQ